MKKNKVFVLGMLAALLAFGLVLAGCENDSSDNTDPKTLIITSVPSNMLSQSTQIGVGPADAESQNDMVAVAGSDTEVSNSTVTAPLYSPGTSNRWTGSGTYSVYISVSSSEVYVARNVEFSSAETTLSASATGDFEKLSP
jgi:hypothetical protein